MIAQHLRASIVLLVIFTLLMGGAYPFLITETAQTLFSYKSNGSLIYKDGKMLGSKLIGQSFSSSQYFFSRPMADSKTIEGRIADNRKDFANPAAIPVDLVTGSGSGLDPDISIASAIFQAPRVAQARNIPLPEIDKFIYENMTARSFNILGENRVNVLDLNLALDKVEADHHE